MQCLQGRHPQQSRDDQEYVRTLITAGDAFCWLGQADRIETLRRIDQVGCIIPSLHTFLEDTKWLEPPAKILRRLLPAASRCSLRNGFKHFFVSSSTHTGQAFTQAYRQLWLSALANFADLSSVKPRIDRRTTQSSTAKSETEVWCDLVRFCHQLGFLTPVAAKEGTDKTRAIAEAAIQSAAPWLLCSAASEGYEKMVTDLAAALRNVPAAPTPHEAMPLLTTDTPESFKLSRRCGRMFEQAYRSNRHILSLDFVYSTQSCIQRNTITPFAVACHIFKSFFREELDIDLDVIPDEAASFLPEASTQNIASSFRSLRRMYLPSTQHRFHPNDEPEPQDVDMENAQDPPDSLRPSEHLDGPVHTTALIQSQKTKTNGPIGIAKRKKVATTKVQQAADTIDANVRITFKCSLEQFLNTYMPKSDNFSCCLWTSNNQRLCVYPLGNTGYPQYLSKCFGARDFVLLCAKKDPNVSHYRLEPADIGSLHEVGLVYVFIRKGQEISTTVQCSQDHVLQNIDQYGRPNRDTGLVVGRSAEADAEDLGGEIL